MSETESASVAEATNDTSNIVQTDQAVLKFASDSTAAPALVEPVVAPDVVSDVKPPPIPQAPPEMKAEPPIQKTKPEESPPAKRELSQDRYAELVDRALKKERLVYLKRLGINTEIMSDEHILQLSPDVDVETPEGKVVIDEWRNQEANERLFVKQEASEIDIESIAADFKGSEHGTFGKDLMIRTLQRLAGK